MAIDHSYGAVDLPSPDENSLSFEQNCSAIQDEKLSDKDSSYVRLLQKNRPFRLYVLSYLVNHLGEWLTYLASIAAIEHIQMQNGGGQQTSRTAISLLLAVRLTPNVLLSPFGGILADGRDRRQSMIALDLAGAGVAWLFLLAFQLQSIPLIYAATFVQECLSGLYEPSRSAILPLLVPEEEEMKKATTLIGITWSAIAAFGAASGGLLVSLIGVRGCFMVDSATYLVSAALMFQVGGTWNVKSSDNEVYDNPWLLVKGMFVDGVQYLQGAFFGRLVFLKASAALVYGGTDILNVSFSDRGSLEGRPARLGLIFCAVGVGGFLGPILVDSVTDMTRPITLQRACLAGFVSLTVGLVLMGYPSPLWLICLFTVIRSMGSSIIWVNSSLLLQKFSRADMLGRVSSIEYGLALVAEVPSALATGVLQDRAHLTAEGASILLGTLGLAMVVSWSVYHLQGKGAGRHTVPQPGDTQKEVESQSLLDYQKP